MTVVPRATLVAASTTSESVLPSVPLTSSFAASAATTVPITLCRWPSCARASSLQELLFFLGLAPFVGALRVQRFHPLQFRLAERRQVPDEPHEAPARRLARFSARGPRRHPRQFDTVFDDIEQRPVAELLR